VQYIDMAKYNIVPALSCTCKHQALPLTVAEVFHKPNIHKCTFRGGSGQTLGITF